MASDAVTEPLISGSLDPPSIPPATVGNASERRRLRTIALVDSLHDSNVNTDSVSPPDSSANPFSNVHPSFRRAALFLTIYLFVGVVCFYFVSYQLAGKKTNGVLDAIYFCVVTMTTVGYGDLVPKSPEVKLLACAFVFTGMYLVSYSLSKAADYLVEKQEKFLVKALHRRKRKVREDEISQEEIDTRRKCYMMFVFLLVLMVAGVIFLMKFEHFDLIDAFYCVCATMSTLGYGDKSFTTEGGRIFGVFWILTSAVSLALFFLYVAELRTEHKQRKLVQKVLGRTISKKDLESADLDKDGVVVAAEFVLHLLKETGKISQKDISFALDKFEHLVVDEPGSSTTIVIAESV